MKLSNENIKNSHKDNAIVEDLHKRLCVIERDKDQALIRLESKENELKKLINLLVLFFYKFESLNFHFSLTKFISFFRQANDKEQNQKIISEFSEKSAKNARELERLGEEHAKLLNQTDDLKNKLNNLQIEKETLQKQLTKQVICICLCFNI